MNRELKAGTGDRPRPFYAIRDNGDGTADVYLDTGQDGLLRAVRGVVPFEGMEEDIRKRYADWCASAEVIWP